MVQDDVKRNLFKVAVFGTLAYATFKLLTGGKKEKSVSSVVSNVVKPVEIVAKTADKVAKKAVRFVKGSPEAKEYMAKIRAKAKGVKKGEGKKSKSKAHKGHATKKGLSQDQKLVSSEPHEKVYQDNKDKIEKIKKKISKYEDLAIENYSKGNDAKGKKYEELSDKIYKENYSILFPEYSRKINRDKEK